MTSTSITASLATLKTASAIVLGLAASFVALGGVPQADAACMAPPRYDELEAQIDQIAADETWDCLVVEHEIVSDADLGDVSIITDITNGCGENVWIYYSELQGNHTAGSLEHQEGVSDGRSVTLSALVEHLQSAAEGQGELQFGVLADSERGSATPEPSDFAPLSRVEYSYMGSPIDNSDWECNDTDSGGCGGCAASSSTPASPANSPLTWVMMGLGLVWIGRRSTHGGRA